MPQDLNGKPMWSTVIGVVEDARYRGIRDVRFDLYVPYLQNPNEPVKHLMVRTTTNHPLSLAPVVRAEARRLDSAALVEGATTMEAIVGSATAPWRFSASTIGFLSVLAIIIATLGVYGIVKQSSVERTKEIAVRVALGASSRSIAGLVLREALIRRNGRYCPWACQRGCRQQRSGQSLIRRATSLIPSCFSRWPCYSAS